MYGTVSTIQDADGQIQNVLKHMLTWFPPALRVPSHTYASSSRHVLASPQLPLTLLFPAVPLQISVTQETVSPYMLSFQRLHKTLG